MTQGDELIGMTRGFIYAGTPSIVASLWSVNDRSTSELMGMFYKNLKNHSKAEALRMAQIEMIRGERLEKVSFGEWEALPLQRKANPDCNRL